MLEFLLLLAPIFFAGVLRGSSICTAVCASGLFSLIAARKRRTREAAKLAILFNLPRIGLLAALGAVVGYISYTFIVSAPWFEQLVMRLGQFSYLIFGLIMLIVGLVLYARTADARASLDADDAPRGPDRTTACGADTAQESCARCSSKYCATRTDGTGTGTDIPPEHDRAADGTSSRQRWYQRLFPTTRTRRESTLVLIWGALAGTACMAKVSVLGVELPAFAIFMASFGANSFIAALYGTLAMAVFGLGSSLPIIVLATIGGALVQRIGTTRRLLAIRTMGAVVMIMIGLLLIYLSANGLRMVG